MALYCIFSTKRAPWWARPHFVALSERPPERGIKPHMSTGRPRKTALYQIGPLQWLPRRNFTTCFSTGTTLYCVLSVSRAPWRALRHILSTGQMVWWGRHHVLSTTGASKMVLLLCNIRLLSPSVGPLPRVVLEACIINNSVKNNLCEAKQ